MERGKAGKTYGREQVQRPRRPPQSGAAAGRRRQRRRRKAIKDICVLTVETVLCVVLLTVLWNQLRPVLSGAEKPVHVGESGAYGQNDREGKGGAGGEMDAGDYGAAVDDSLHTELYPQELQELLELNEETLDYVTGYPDRDAYIGQPIDLTEDFTAGEVPLLMQWDRRWGYDLYGSSMIGLSGCGPLCMTMAYLYFTEDTDMTPRDVAEYAQESGYHTSAGTSWTFWTEGAKGLGLRGKEIPLDQHSMQAVLDEGGLIVCSMRPGDFTTQGHFILIRGYDENGFFVNDPNRRSTSGRQWEYDTLRYQINNLWELRGGN